MQMTRQASALETDVIEVMRVSISPESVLVVLEINLTQLIRAGESYYFKIDGLFIQRLKQYREARVMLCSPEGDSLRDVLQDHMPLGPHGPY
ncbi:hypothetical protein COL940_014399, partial [Colletotrichum noveboracense]